MCTAHDSLLHCCVGSCGGLLLFNPLVSMVLKRDLTLLLLCINPINPADLAVAVIHLASVYMVPASTAQAEVVT